MVQNELDSARAQSDEALQRFQALELENQSLDQDLQSRKSQLEALLAKVDL